MSDQVLDILKLVFLGLLYLFFARVLWAVWSEVRRPAEMSAGPAHRSRSGAGDPARLDPRPEGHARTGRSTRDHRAEAPPRGSGSPSTGEITIGRDASCTITIDNDAFVSGLHARVFDLDGQPMVEDLDSTNGSFLNGNRLQGMRLLHRGDRIQVGYTVLEAQ